MGTDHFTQGKRWLRAQWATSLHPVCVHAVLVMLTQAAPMFCISSEVNQHIPQVRKKTELQETRSKKQNLHSVCGVVIDPGVGEIFMVFFCC